MNVLSLFDGMSCGQLALNRAGIEYDKYFASEIDKHAIKVTQSNYPNTIQLGSIVDIRRALTWKKCILDRFYNSKYITAETKLKYKELEKLKGIKIDLLTGGSPCQGFSFAGKQLNFSDPLSKLFFEFVKLLKYFKPKYFLLENVNMKKKYLRVISEHLGVFPVNINSNLVSAQNRNRWYWTNIRTKDKGLFSELWADIPQPKDKGILLKDILQPENEIDKKYYLDIDTIEYIKKNKFGQAGGLTKGIGVYCVAQRGRNPENPSDRTAGIKTEQRLEINKTGKTNCLTSVQKDNYILQRPHGRNKGGIVARNGKTPAMTISSWQDNNYVITRPIRTGNIGKGGQGHRVYSPNGKNVSLCANGGGRGAKTGLIETDKTTIRKLTPVECERLQTVSDNYTAAASDSQRYKMLGNGWTIDVITHIFNYMKTD